MKETKSQMILIVTNKFDPTADIVAREFHRLGVHFLRFNTEEFPLAVQLKWSISNHDPIAARLDLGHNRSVALSDVRSIYYRRPQAFQLAPQLQSAAARDFANNECRAAVEGLWDTANCLWVSHPRRIQAASNKPEQLRRAKALGLPVPRTLITNDEQAARDFYDLCDGKVIAKVLRNNIIETDGQTGLIYTTRLYTAELAKLATLRHAPCIFQEYVPKQLEVRTTVVGRQLFSVEIHSQCSDRTRDDWRHYDLPNTPHLIHTLPSALEEKCLALVEAYGLNFAAIDFIVTPDGEYVFLELNPNGQWAWLEQLTGVPICRAIVELLLG